VMDAERRPCCYIVAGPNGAGKTTFALKYLPAVVSCHDFVNADEIAKGLSPLDFQAGMLQAGKIFLETLEQKIAARRDFAFETTLSGRMYLPKIAQWRKDGWKVVLIYLFVPSAEFSAMRVRQRVLQGGHDIPKDDILRRFPRSVQNLFEYAQVCDQTLCLDNEGEVFVPIFEKRLGSPIEIHDAVRFPQLHTVLRTE
jgi:predicted ABC-type ATPase